MGCVKPIGNLFRYHLFLIYCAVLPRANRGGMRQFIYVTKLQLCCTKLMTY